MVEKKKSNNSNFKNNIMKITSTQEEKKFEPITFNITVESKEELEQFRDAFGKSASNNVTNNAYLYVLNIIKDGRN
jgi:hypothetical protein